VNRVQFLRDNINRFFDEMQHRYAHGLITEEEWKAWVQAWDWTAPRHSGYIGHVHDRYYATYGPKRYWRRINHFRRLVGLPAYEAQSWSGRPATTKEQL